MDYYNTDVVLVDDSLQTHRNAATQSRISSEYELANIVDHIKYIKSDNQFIQNHRQKLWKKETNYSNFQTGQSLQSVFCEDIRAFSEIENEEQFMVQLTKIISTQYRRNILRNCDQMEIFQAYQNAFRQIFMKVIAKRGLVPNAVIHTMVVVNFHYLPEPILMVDFELFRDDALGMFMRDTVLETLAQFPDLATFQNFMIVCNAFLKILGRDVALPDFKHLLLKRKLSGKRV